MASDFPSWMGEQPPPPDPRSFSAETAQFNPFINASYQTSSQGYGDLTQRLMEQQWQSDVWNQNRQWNFFQRAYPQMVQMQAQQQQQFFPTQLAQQDILYAQNLQAQRNAAAGGRLDAYGFLSGWGTGADLLGRQATPLYGDAYNRLQGMVGQIGQRSDLSRTLDAQARTMLDTGGPTTPFTETLDQQALAELKLGGAMTPEEERMAQQSARQAFAARGQAMGDPAALAEVLNRDSYSQARLRERQAIAGGREQAGLQRLEYGQQFAGGREGLEIARQQQEADLAMKAGQWANANNPIWGLMGMGFGAPNASITPMQTTGVSLDPTMTQGMSRSVPMPTAPDLYSNLFGSTLSYGGDLFNSNMSMQADLYNNWMNNAAAIEGANIQASGALAGAKTAAGGAVAGSAIGAVGAVAGGIAIAF